MFMLIRKIIPIFVYDRVYSLFIENNMCEVLWKFSDPIFAGARFTISVERPTTKSHENFFDQAEIC
jgi:hypothetical protein